jgi:hypothetical protein
MASSLGGVESLVEPGDFSHRRRNLVVNVNTEEVRASEDTAD